MVEWLAGNRIQGTSTERTTGTTTYSTIALDTRTSVSNSGTQGTTMTRTITIGTGSNRALFVCLNTDPNVTVSHIKLDGVAFTEISGTVRTDVGKNSIWQLINPASGTGTITVTWGASAGYVGMSAISFTGVDQTTPVNTSNITSSYVSTGGSGVQTVSITPANTGSAIFGYVVTQRNVYTTTGSGSFGSKFLPAGETWSSGAAGFSQYDLSPTIGSANNLLVYTHNTATTNQDRNIIEINCVVTVTPSLMPSLQSPSVGGWVEVGRTTLSSAGDTIDVSSLPNKRYYMVLTSDIADGTIDARFRLGNGSVDTGSNYARRGSENGASEVTGTGNDSLLIPYAENGNTHFFGVHYFANKSNKEKLLTGHCVDEYASGAGQPPARFENAGKWSNTSDVIDVIRNYNAQSGSFDTGSEMVVLGWDPTDTHTTNFWEELASVTTTSSGTISSGTITAKKYLMYSIIGKKASGTGTEAGRFQFNGDTGSNYAQRNSINGTDYTYTGQSSMNIGGDGNTAGEMVFLTGFIINNTSNEKLLTGHSVFGNTAGAGQIGNRGEIANKWANTSDQITSIECMGTTFEAGAVMKVWGSD